LNNPPDSAEQKKTSPNHVAEWGGKKSELDDGDVRERKEWREKGAARLQA